MSLWIVILIAGAAQALILSIAIISKREKRHYPLLILLSLIALGLTLRIAYTPSFYLKWLKVVQLSDLFLLLFGPIFWFFIRSGVQTAGKRDWRKLTVHALPALAFLLHYLVVILPFNNRDFVVAENAGQFNVYYTILLGGGILLNATYWILSFRLVSKNYQSSRKSANFLKLVLGINALSILAWATGYILSFTGPQWYTTLSYTYQLAFVALAASSILISYHALSSASFWLEHKPIRKYAKSRLSDEDIDHMGKKLDRFIDQEQVYLDPSFTLDQLSSAVEINKVQLSQVINQYMGKGFADWINEHRVDTFISKAESQNYQHLTLFGIAMESGFNTKATFNKAFKKAKGMTPSQYIGQQLRSEPVLSK